MDEFAGRVAVFPIAQAGDKLKAGNFRVPRGGDTQLVEDIDYLNLRERATGGTRGYAPCVHVQVEVAVPEDNVGCVMIYDSSAVLASVRERAEQLQALRQESAANRAAEQAVPAPMAAEAGAGDL